MIFNIYNGLNYLIDGPIFKGGFNNHTEEEYNNIIWLDDRDKPSWVDVENECLTFVRRELIMGINERTSNLIQYGFHTSIDSTANYEIWGTPEWQFNVSQLVAIRDNLTYPYYLKVSETKDGITNYLTMETPNDFITLFNEFMYWTTVKLAEGRNIKDSLINMTREELENFVDPRGEIIPPE